MLRPYGVKMVFFNDFLMIMEIKIKHGDTEARRGKQLKN